MPVLQDIEAVDPEYYKNLRWMLENNITDVLDLTFTEESDYFGKKELVELKPGGKDIRSALLLSPLLCAWPPDDKGGREGGTTIGAWDCCSIFCILHAGHTYWFLVLLPTLFSISLCPASAEGLCGDAFSISFPYIPLAPCLHMHMQTHGKWYVGKRYRRFACAEHIDLGFRSVNMGEVASML